MVTLNFTIVVELILFLVFLWGTKQFILRPLLEALDAREASLQESEAHAQESAERAAALEAQYHTESAAMRRAADENFRGGRRKALNEHGRHLAEERHQADEAVAAAREAARAQVDNEQSQCAALAPELADILSERLGVGEERR